MLSAQTIRTGAGGPAVQTGNRPGSVNLSDLQQNLKQYFLSALALSSDNPGGAKHFDTFTWMMSGLLSINPEGRSLELKFGANSPFSRITVSENENERTVAWRTPQFWLLWLVLWLNVTAGIGLLGIASPMFQEIFAGKLLSLDLAWNELNDTQLRHLATIAAGFIGLLSLFNILGRFFWASVSDACGRKTTFIIMLLFGAILYGSLPLLNHSGYIILFVCSLCIIISMYGGGFATIPAYLADVFGSQMVEAIHGRLLTAWYVAGISGSVLVNYLREYQLSQGITPEKVYDITLVVLTILLIVGFICNLMIRPIPEKYAMTEKKKQQSRGMYTVKKDVRPGHHI